MRSLLRLLILALIVSSPAQSWAAPMLCQSDMNPSSATLGHAHDTGHAHHADMQHDSSKHESLSGHEHSSSNCESNCECGDCVLTVVLSDTELASVTAYREERVAICDSHHALYLDTIFRPPIST